MKNIWIIGVGRFGRMAADRLTGKTKNLSLVMVDPEKEKLRAAQGPGRTFVEADGVGYLFKHLRSEGAPLPDWIIPAVPVHLAAEWQLLIQGPEKLQRIPVPVEVDPLLPHPLRGENGDVYVSHADFLCPDNCPEPRDICTFTGKPRKQNMFELLTEIPFPPWENLVIRSHQLGPGIGGYRPQQLFDLAAQIEKTHGPILLSTACRCHGVMTGLQTGSGST